MSPILTRASATTSPGTPRGRAYDPWEHADALGIEVVVRRLRTANGRWFPDYNTIVISDRLRSRDQRLVLSHEIGHGVLLHTDETVKSEKQADQFAARNLICPDELADLYEWCPDERRIAAELGVTTTLFRAYVLAQAA
ncbi:ImmA/IrrE family metallo-endopeptidase [Microbacterium sp. K22]|uniref:ImmA/IrrE family metallo-endopeptidase n=1 Tax=Microbacterium sp. K22 TaxID=2305447 RepID=UPI00197B45BA|nr:ImmA/IrrE family metallo-endopeptidase [Microbacterium sp. K22]